ncbi:MAG: BMC domain-containing protein [Desulfovibrio sp.]|nr:BMC domain-containing protein [Desulfovibrio sp.]MBI4960621.1 BMC domain-containing protein [Desulfovibrio sp.]
MDTLGIVESKSIAAGGELADAMVKVASVELVRATTICSGRYMIHVAGDREAVETSVRVARESGRVLAGSFVISNVSSQVIDVLKKSSMAKEGDALGIIECRTVSSGVAAADSAVKRSVVSLLRLVMGQGINGKSYFVISGDVASVEEAAEAAKSALGKDLVEAVVIPRPSASVVQALTSVARL